MALQSSNFTKSATISIPKWGKKSGLRGPDITLLGVTETWVKIMSETISEILNDHPVNKYLIEPSKNASAAGIERFDMSIAVV